MTEAPHLLILIDDDEDYLADLAKGVDFFGENKLRAKTFTNKESFESWWTRRAKAVQAGSAIVMIDLSLNYYGEGIDILRFIRDKRYGERQFVIVMSSSRAQSDINDAYNAGANLFLPKSMGRSLERLISLLISIFEDVGLGRR